MQKMRIGSRAYLLFSRCRRLLPQRLLVFFQAIWLGLLDASALDEITNSYYSGLSGGFGSEQHNLQGLWPWEANAVEASFANGKTLLVAGAGGGREAVALARLGFDVTAIDRSGDLVADCLRNADKAGVSLRALEAESGRVPAQLGAYDGIFAGRAFYHHIPGREQRVVFLKDCRVHLLAGAPLFLSDFQTRPSQLIDHRKTYSVANWIRKFRPRSRPVEVGDWLDYCLQHAFIQSEIESELNAGGFELESYAQSPLGEDARMAHVLARAC